MNATQQLVTMLRSNLTPPAVPTSEFDADVTELLKLYPDIPALGSPFGTGNETFGLSSQFKRASALNGDTVFQSQRRSTAQVLGTNGVPVFAYLFTDPQPSQSPFLGGK